MIGYYAPHPHKQYLSFPTTYITDGTYMGTNYDPAELEGSLRCNTVAHNQFKARNLGNTAGRRRIIVHRHRSVERVWDRLPEVGTSTDLQDSRNPPTFSPPSKPKET